MLKDKAALMTLIIFFGAFLALWGTSVTSTGHLIEKLMTGYMLAWGLYAFLSGLPRKEIRARFVLLTLVGVLTLATAEIPGAFGIINYQSLLGAPGREWFDRQGYARPSIPA